MHDVLERAACDQLQGAAGHDLLGRLEQQPHAAAQLTGLLELGERDARAHQGGGVHVVAAGVRDARDRARPRLAAAVVDRQRVEVGAKRDDRALLRTEVRDQPAAREQLHPHSRLVEPLGYEGGGALLLPGELGVRVEVAAEVDQLVPDGRDGALEVGEMVGT